MKKRWSLKERMQQAEKEGFTLALEKFKGFPYVVFSSNPVGERTHWVRISNLSDQFDAAIEELKQVA